MEKFVPNTRNIRVMSKKWIVFMFVSFLSLSLSYGEEASKVVLESVDREDIIKNIEIYESSENLESTTSVNGKRVFLMISNMLYNFMKYTSIIWSTYHSVLYLILDPVADNNDLDDFTTLPEVLSTTVRGDINTLMIQIAVQNIISYI